MNKQFETHCETMDQNRMSCEGSTDTLELKTEKGHHKAMSALRLPLLLLIRTSTFWFFLGSFLALLSTIKLVIPSFLDGISLLTYGRLFPVACDLLVYGWALQAGLAVSLWLIVRLCEVKIHSTRILISAAVLLNLSIFLSSLAMLCGRSTSIGFLEYPAWGSFLLFVSFVLIGIWVIFPFLSKHCNQISCSYTLSHGYLLAAVCSFPWAYATANLLLVWGHLQGSAQGLVHYWYLSVLFGFCLIPFGLAAAYYLVSTITGASVENYSLGKVGLFSLLLFVGWSGMTLLFGGPIPAWTGSASIVATILLILPIMALLVNFFKMLEGKKTILIQSPALRFIYVGILFFIISAVLAVMNAVPSFNAIFHFTDYTIGLFVSLLIGFYGMTFFGAFYYILPRLTGITWLSVGCVLRHFWMITVGVGLMVAASFLGGMLEGFALNDPAIAFINVLSYATPWRWLMVLAWLLIFLGSLSFVRLMVMMRWQLINANAYNK